MNTKIMIVATVAALSLATTAFAGEGNGDPFPFHAPGQVVQAPGTTDVGSAQYEAPLPVQSRGGLWQDTLPENGQNGAVESANSLPAGALVGTTQYARAQSVNQWFAQQADHRFAQAHLTRPNG